MEAVRTSYSYAQVIQKLHLRVAGSNYDTVKRKIEELHLDTSHMTVKQRRCECCGLTEWQGQPIALELHHINAIRDDQRLENLQLLCPNCHTLTDNYRGKNKGKECSGRKA